MVQVKIAFSLLYIHACRSVHIDEGRCLLQFFQLAEQLSLHTFIYT